MKFVTIAAALLAAAAMTGCTTITRGTNDVWEVTTEPIGAEVTTSNGYVCDSTPCAIRMPRRSEFVATITLDGYEPATVNVTHQISGAGGAGMAGNVLVGGLIGVAVDASSGAMNDLVPNPVHLVLTPIGAAPAPQVEAMPLTQDEPDEMSEPMMEDVSDDMTEEEMAEDAPM